MKTHLLLGVLGIGLGMLREFGVINYMRCVVQRNRVLGSLISLGMGILDLFVLAMLAWDKEIILPIGYIIGETMETYLGIGKQK